MSAAVREVLDDKYRVREIGLTNSRQIIRRSANAIRSIHRGEMDAAVVLMEEAGTLLAETNRELEDHPDILYAGFVSDASKEYAELGPVAAGSRANADLIHRRRIFGRRRCLRRCGWR